MISDDGDQMSGPLKILFPFRKSEDNSKKLSIIDVIVLFSGNERLRKVGTQVEVGISILLK
jgi:hypothetical protein